MLIAKLGHENLCQARFSWQLVWVKVGGNEAMQAFLNTSINDTHDSYSTANVNFWSISYFKKNNINSLILLITFND